MLRGGRGKEVKGERKREKKKRGKRKGKSSNPPPFNTLFWLCHCS